MLNLGGNLGFSGFKINPSSYSELFKLYEMFKSKRERERRRERELVFRKIRAVLKITKLIKPSMY